ncbi:MAG TPA: ABC transporter substrate-binding protein [Alphaproteobacteria bacterium]|nr:ABC transporter substrate-binding protein [Alphaproteobacteria bacterium]
MIRFIPKPTTFVGVCVLMTALMALAVPQKAMSGSAVNTPTGSTGANPLIGKLEGPQVVTDPAMFPKAFQEAPQLAELVKAGKLPPVAERIGQDPLVLKPVHGIGKYGGTWRRGFTGPADFWNGYRCCSGPDHLFFWDYTGDKIVPNIAKGYEFGDGGRTLTVHLRRGMRWSDGQPFTADDFVFWYEDVYGNKELFPVPSSVMMIHGQPGEIAKVDTYTVMFRFPQPYYMLPDVLAGSTPLGGQTNAGQPGMGGYAPAHYLRQFHPKYVAKEELDRKVKEAKFDNWVNLFKFKTDWALNPELPVVSPWKTVTPINTPTWTLERNPYSIWVDTAGNQLPYIDRVVLTLAENLEVLNLRAIAGEYDLQERHVDLGKVPVILENQQRGGYKLYLDPGDYGGDMIIKFNLSYDADPELAKWFNTADFRRALALGIDRDQINETFWLGTGTPSSVVPADHNKYNPGPEYRTLWATYDPQKANAMLDKLGLDEKDAEGYRLRTDGKGRLRIEITTLGGQFLQFTQIAEMIREQWKKIGIDLAVQEVERSLAIRRADANEQQLCAWNNDGSEHLFTFPVHVFPYGLGSLCTSGPLYGKWFQSAGAQGKEPPARVRELMEKFRRAFGVPEEERIQLGKEIWKIAAEDVHIIGVIGMGAASMGVRIAKVNLGNVPARQYNSPDGKTPSISRPVTFFFKN